jgi:Uncharacterized protein conserved in bacteria (DUF2184)
MDLALVQQLQNAAIDVVRTIENPTPIAAGKLINFSDYGYALWDRAIEYTSIGFAANFRVHHRSPYVRSNVGTVNLTEQPRIIRQPIFIESCEVDLDAETMKTWERVGILDLYTEQLKAKVIAWDQLVENALLYGIPSLNIPGLLQGSGIPIYAEPLNFALATPQQMLTQCLALINSVAINSKMRFQPTRVGMPLNFFNLLNTTTMSSTDSRSVLTVLRERLAEGFGTGDSMPREIIAVPSLDTTRTMVILDTAVGNVGACVFDLEETSSGEYRGGYTSKHSGGIAGVVAKRPMSSLIVRLLY